MIHSPITLPHGLELKNRLVVAPMTTYSSRDDGVIADDEIPYLARRAKGGFGMVMTAACYVHPRGKAFDGQWACWSDDFIPSLARVAEVIQENGSTAVLQIHHGGRACPSRLCGGPPLSASAIPAERPNAETPQAMTDDEIEEAIFSFAQAAVRAAEAGYDAVEIHGANTYLLQQFVSPHSNRREDEWGEDRLAFPLAVTDAVMQSVPGVPVGYRFSPEEIETPGIRLADTLALVEALCERDLSWLHISLGNFRQGSLVKEFDDPILTRVSKAIAGRIPFMGVGSIKTHEDAEACLALGCQMVALARTALTDAEWPQHAANPVLKLPATGAGAVATLPAPLEKKIYATPGWVPVEEA